MNQEIYLANIEDKIVVYVGRQKEIEAGRIGKDAAKLIAVSEGKKLLVVDGHQAMDMIYRDTFRDYP